MATVPRKDRRESALFRLYCESRPRDSEVRSKGPLFNLTDVVGAWEAARKAGDAVMYIDQQGQEQPGPWKEGYSRLRLEKIVVNRIKGGKFHSYCLLLSYANARAADPGRRDFRNNKINLLKLGDDGGLEFGAHLVIGDISKSSYINSSKCVLEEMTGLGRARVIRFLERVGDHFLPESSRPTWTHKPRRGPGIDLVGRLRLTSHAERSDSLQNLVENGRVVGVDFIQPPKPWSLTDEFPTQLEAEEVVLRASVRMKTDSLAANRRILRAAADFARGGGWKMRTEIEQGEGVDARRKVRPFDLEETDLEDQMYARRHPMTVSSNLPQCYEDINAEVNDALCQILDQASLWT